MKVCPKCNSSFTNDSLTICPDDGTDLIADDSVIDSAAVPVSADTTTDAEVAAAAATKGTKDSTPEKKKGAAAAQADGSKWTGYIISAVILVLVGVGAYFVISKNRASSPTDTYKNLYAAVKSKNTDSIKKWMSKKTLGFAEGVAAQQKTPIDDVFKNGFTGTTFAASMPPMRDERIKDDMGALEVWNAKDQRWEDLPFVKEEDGWKLAVGDLFAGTYETPEKGQAAKDAEEANKLSNNMIMGANTNGNYNGFKPKIKNIPMPQMPANGQSMKGNVAPGPQAPAPPTPK